MGSPWLRLSAVLQSKKHSPLTECNEEIKPSVSLHCKQYQRGFDSRPSSASSSTLPLFFGSPLAHLLVPWSFFLLAFQAVHVSSHLPRSVSHSTIPFPFPADLKPFPTKSLFLACVRLSATIPLCSPPAQLSYPDCGWKPSSGAPLVSRRGAGEHLHQSLSC